MSTTTTRDLRTTHGLIHTVLSTTSTPSSLPTILLLHGNSSSSLIFRPLLTHAALTSTHTILALDLPGHGRSSNAASPHRTYTMRGYAEAALEVCTQLALKHVVVLGWSLGGHIAIELVALLRSLHAGPGGAAGGVRVLGVLLVGTPPGNGAEQTGRGFRGDAKHMGLAAKEVLTEQEAGDYGNEMVLRGGEGWMVEGVKRTDGRARRIMFESFAGGKGVDQVGVVENDADVLWGVVNGAEEPYVNLEYVDGIKWANLWEGKCHRMDGLGHTPFWDHWETFAPILERFVAACEADSRDMAKEDQRILARHPI